jgi:hypothetical protein
MVRTRSGKETIAKGSCPAISKQSRTKPKLRILKLKQCALLTEFTQIPSPIPESGEIILSKEIADAVLSSLQLHTPHELVGVRRFDFFAQNASIGTPIETILWKWLNQVVRSGMPWQDAVHQIPDILKNRARKIMFKNHGRLYLSKII